jgi:PadR family transcriptional regulator, regulatory protein PadR
MASRDRLRGTLDVLILRTLADGPRHGYAICRWLEEQSGDGLIVEQGSLYPALYRLEERGLIRSRERMSELGRPAKFYEITAAGRSHLTSEAAAWLAFSRTVTRLLKGQS